MVNPRVRDGEEEVLAEVSMSSPCSHNKGLRFSVNDSLRAEGEALDRSLGLGISGRVTGQGENIWDKCGRELR